MYAKPANSGTINYDNSGHILIDPPTQLTALTINLGNMSGQSDQKDLTVISTQAVSGLIWSTNLGVSGMVNTLSANTPIRIICDGVSKTFIGV